MKIRWDIVQRLACYWALACLPVMIEQLKNPPQNFTEWLQAAAIISLPGWAVHRAFLDRTMARAPEVPILPPPPGIP